MNSIEKSLLFTSVMFLNKPSYLTSAETIKKIRDQIRTRFHLNPKIGHTGTLDKFAEGLLILLINKATCFSSVFLKEDKSYIAEIQLGKTTDTLDPEGNILDEWEEKKIHKFMEENQKRIVTTIQNFINQTRQIPPEYSAIKINGKRASDWIRKGKDIDLPVKNIEIYESEVLGMNSKGIVTARFHVSSGTYIRSIARDIGKELGIPAMLNRLQRISIGKWSLFSPWVSKFEEDNWIFVPIVKVLDDWDKMVIQSNSDEYKILNGVKIRLDLSSVRSNNILLINNDGMLLAWIKKLDGKNYIYKKVFTR